MRGNHSFKKTAALVLSCVLALGAVPLSPLVYEAHAETAAADPSKVAYATKTDLMNIPTTDGSDYAGDVSKVGRIKLGKDASYKVMEWYILGSDSGVNGDNVAIFAASNIVDSYSQKFREDFTWEETPDSYTKWEEKYGTYSGTTVTKDTELYYNHYGASDLRKALRSMGGETDDDSSGSSNFFSNAELDMLQATTVMTQDYKNGSPAVYTTTDKLYAAWGDPKRYADEGDTYAIGGEGEHIYIGSKSGKKREGIEITLENLGATKWFVLRSPGTISEDPNKITDVHVLCACDGCVYDWVGSESTVRPASNLNLSSVIFASAASASSGTAAAGTIKTTDDTDDMKDAMMLRLDGSGQNIGSVSTDAESGIITATKGTTNGDVVLVVQGRNADTDWYYSKPITSTTDGTLTLKDDIVPALTDAGVELEDTDEEKAAQIDLTKCRIWLETPVEPTVSAANRTLFYAVTGHTYNEWKSNNTNHWKECTDSGCSNKEYDGTHDYGKDEGKDAWSYDDDSHYKKCTVCGYCIDKDAHQMGEDGKCTVCNYDIDEKHDWIEVPEQKPTCTEVGYQQYWHCEDGYDVKYYAGSLGILVKFTDMSDIEIPATGHTPAEAWSCNAIYHWQVCEVCDAKLTDTRAKHKFDGGRICTICEYERSYDSDSSDDDDSSSYTADTVTAGPAAADAGTAGSVTPDADGSWSQDEQGLRFEYADGSYAKGTVTTAADGTSELQVAWEKVAGGWFAFDADGYAVQDWVYDAAGKSWYYCDTTGMKTGLMQSAQDGNLYYLDPNSGAMLTGWVTIDGKRYYFSEAHNGTYYQDPVTYKWVYANPDQNRPLGSMYVNTITPDGSFVGADGARIEQ